MYDFLGLGMFRPPHHHPLSIKSASKSGTSQPTCTDTHTYAHMQMHLCAGDFKGPIQLFELVITNSSLGICSAWQPCWSAVIVRSRLIDRVPLSVIWVSWRLQVRHPVMTSPPVLCQMTLRRLGRMLDLTEGEEETSTSLCRQSAYQAKEEFRVPFESNFNYSERGEETLVWWRFCLCSLKPVLPFCSAR